MNNSLRSLLRQVPKWRVIYLFVLSGMLTPLTIMIGDGILLNFLYSSTTLAALSNSLIDIVGMYKFYRIKSEVGPYVVWTIGVGVFLFYLWVFLKIEKRKLFEKNLTKIMEDVVFIAEGNFDYQITGIQEKSLRDFSKNINVLVQALKSSIEEELKAEQAKNELITNVSHDLRTPLTSIVGYLNLIEQDKYKDEVELRYYTQIVHSKVKVLNQLIEDLFEYTRVRNSEMRLDKGPINLNEMLCQLEIQFRMELTHAGMTIREAIPDERIYVLGDSMKLARVFENIFTNAIKYGERETPIDIAVDVEQENVTVAISNYGEPIPSMDLPYIFERFYRVEKSRSDKTGGSGLGLAIAKGIIELHGGNIEVESQQNKTTFKVSIPRFKDNL